MFGKREVDMSPRRFWTWFENEAQGIANAFEALSRGEADTDWAFESLNSRLRRFHASLEADIVRTLDGKCHLTLSGEDHAVQAMLSAAPRPVRLALHASDDLAEPPPRSRSVLRRARRWIRCRSRFRACTKPTPDLHRGSPALTAAPARCDTLRHGCPEQDLHPHR